MDMKVTVIKWRTTELGYPCIPQTNKPEKEYKAEFEDEEFEIFSAENDDEAMKTAFSFEEEHGTLFNVFEIDKNYDEIRTII